MLLDEIDLSTEFWEGTYFNIPSELQKSKLNRFSKDTKCSNFVYNLSEHSIERTVTEEFNFVIIRARIPVENIISNVKSSIRKIEDRKVAESIRQGISYIARKKPPMRNLFYYHFQRLRVLKNNDDIIFLPVDKSNASIVKHAKDYKTNMNILLNDQAYAETITETTTYLEISTSILVKMPPINLATQKQQILREK